MSDCAVSATDSIKLTEYSHGAAGCGCKISPKVLTTILASQLPVFTPILICWSAIRVAMMRPCISSMMKLALSVPLIFMPIVDDPFTFGRIAATNAISDIYAMGGTPMMAIAILGWPINKLPAEIAQQVVDGGRQACMEAGIMLAGGHSIDAPEPIFGLAINGANRPYGFKTNDTAKTGDRLYLTKPIGIGILTTAQKRRS